MLSHGPARQRRPPGLPGLQDHPLARGRDAAISAKEVTLAVLFAFTKPDRVLFESDFPNAPREAISRSWSWSTSVLAVMERVPWVACIV
jgi:hypothetical protein